MLNELNEAPQTHIKSEVIATGPTMKIVRVFIPDGEALPPHPAKGRIAVAVVAGEGRINVAGRELSAEPGRIVEVAAGALHSIYADQALELLLIHE